MSDAADRNCLVYVMWNSQTRRGRRQRESLKTPWQNSKFSKSRNSIDPRRKQIAQIALYVLKKLNCNHLGPR